MNKSLKYSFAAISAVTIVSLGAVGSKPAVAQVAKALVYLQPSSPGTAQTGHTNISGNGIFGGNVGIATTPTTLFNLDVRRHGWVPPAMNYRGAIRGSTGTGTGTDCGVLGVTDVGNGLAGIAHQPGGWGVVGQSFATTGPGLGGYFEGNSNQGIGVKGVASASTGYTNGVYGESSSSTGTGVHGVASANNGIGSYGVFGESEAGTGVRGEGKVGGNFMSDANFGSGVTGNAYGNLSYGGAFYAYGDNGYGVVGVSYATSGVSYGVFGSVESPNGWSGSFLGGKGTYTSRLSVDTVNSTYPIQMADAFGDKISLYGAGTTSVGFGVQGNALQIHTDYVGSDVVFGFGSSAALSETMRVKGNGNVGIGTSTPASKLDVNGRTTTDDFTMRTGGAANTVLLGAAGGVASWGTVGSARLSSDAASFSKVTNGNFSIADGDLEGGDQSMIRLFTGTTEKVRLAPNTAAFGAILNMFGPNGNWNARMAFLTGQPDHGFVTVNDSAGTAQAQMYVDNAGNGIVTADTKNFVVPDPTDPRYNIVYACVEGPEAAMYTRGTGQLVNGQAVINLPEHFLKLANMGTLTIQVTPLDECEGLFCRKGDRQFLVKELRKGQSNIEFDWEVKAVRKGHEDYQVVRPWDDALPDGAKKQMWNARLESIAAKQATTRNRSNRP